jgi:hypothetical protein
VESSNRSTSSSCLARAPMPRLLWPPSLRPPGPHAPPREAPRGLALGWLLCAQRGEFDEEDLEPPVPAGHTQLSASQQCLAEFLRIDADLLLAAAKASSLKEDWYPKPAGLGVWLATRPGAEKDALLARLIAGNEPGLAADLLRRVAHARRGERPRKAETSPRRPVRELLERAVEIAAERERLDAEGRAKQRVAQERR